MTKNQLRYWRDRLTEYSDRARNTAGALEEQTLVPTGGEAGGSLSNAPMHLGDVATGVYQQELNATLFQHEEYVLRELADALARIDRGTFGTCENCGSAIPEGRLEAVAYARYCVRCTQKLGDELPANLNRGRPEAGVGVVARRDTQPTAETEAADLNRDPALMADREEDRGQADVHAAGTAGGGTAVGGLAGTNIGAGAPSDAGLEDAMGSGNFDVEANADEDDGAYAGPTGGAVGGTPAGKRATGGRSES